MSRQFSLLILFIAIYLNGFSQTSAWHNPFPKNGLNESYSATFKAESASKNTYLFKVKKNRVCVLYDWKGNKAPFGLLTSTKKYSSFNLELEYKWGKRKFEPRLEQKRDAGILFHVHGNILVWPSSLECQIQENDTGDLWVIKGPKVTVKNTDASTKLVDASGKKKYVSSVKYANHEKKGWNKVRVEVRANSSAKFYVNGNLVNEITNFFDAEGNALSNGYIGIQAEGAELTYKNIRIQEL
ncbi:3-keto-disaccharide hydrolase [Seonamhaeicola marinus]|uniref:DUF1080 domain-containing protein n=1 Tax=Seonamhaeicola marinus TaxID=1912246 RepID=A0A5D0HJ16_9FLAO|nr:DUF1080 domain-containing protein [Seonamhaeicola marinus]TYA70047.1 DUF1080 domain-containing protein [Seonamhaeicola marinus]